MNNKLLNIVCGTVVTLAIICLIFYVMLQSYSIHQPTAEYKLKSMFPGVEMRYVPTTEKDMCVTIYETKTNQVIVVWKGMLGNVFTPVVAIKNNYFDGVRNYTYLTTNGVAVLKEE